MKRLSHIDRHKFLYFISSLKVNMDETRSNHPYSYTYIFRHDRDLYYLKILNRILVKSYIKIEKEIYDYFLFTVVKVIHIGDYYLEFNFKKVEK